MWNFIPALIITILCTIGSDASTDPCSSAIQIGNTQRTITYDAGSCNGQQCDSFITEGQWYRLDGLTTGIQMPETCVPVWHCGTYAPIWLNGAHPSEAYPGPTLVPICAQLMVNGDCCGWTSSMQVKWCPDAKEQEYYVYQLQVPPFCDMAYCAGSGIDCMGGTWNAVLNNCTNILYPPVLSTSVSLTIINPSATKSVIDNNGKTITATMFGVQCSFTYQNGVQKVDDGARFDVLFLSDGTLVSKTTLTSMESTVVVIDELLLTGYLNHNLMCSVTSYWTAPFPARNPSYSNSKSKYFGIQIIDVNGNIIESISIQDGQTATVNIQPTFPVTAAYCFNLAPGTPCNPNYQFQIFSNNIYLSNCTFQLSSTTPSTSIVLSPIPEPNTIFGTFPFQITAGNTVQTVNSIFGGYVSGEIPVTTTPFSNSDPWITCTSSGDPHVYGFYSSTSYYHIAYPGDFIMFTDTSKNIEIQTRLYVCNPPFGPVYCQCGVIAREGNNIIGVDNCDSSQPVVTRYLLDTTNPGGTIVIENGWYTITLLSGIQIVFVPSWGYITISCKNSGSYGGFCTHPYNPYPVVCAPSSFAFCNTPWWGSCIDDCLTDYRVSGTDSLFSITASTSASSLCLSSPAVQPSCNCQNGASSPCHNVLDQSIPRPALHTCPPSSSKRRRRETNSDPGAQPMAYYPTSPTSAELTQQTYTQQQALAACTSSLSGTTSFNFCTNTLQVNTTFIVDFCVIDVLATNDIDFYTSSVSSQLEILCSQAIQNPKNPGNQTEQQLQFKQLVCPNQCSSKGSCTNGICSCDTGFMGDDCSIVQGAVPSIISALDVCDIRQDSCLLVYLIAANVSQGATCKLKPTTGFTYYDNSPTINGAAITCQLNPTTINTAGSSFSTTNYTVAVSLSNDNMTYSNVQSYTVYDGLCVWCNTSTDCQNLNTSCNICGRCYASQAAFNSTSSYVCDPSKCTTKWSTGQSKSCSDGYVPCISSNVRVSVSGFVLLFSYMFYAAMTK